MSTFSTCTSSTRPSSPTDGDVLFETDLNRIIVWDGTNWRTYRGSAFVGNPNRFTLNFDGTNDYGTTGYTPGASAGFSASMWVKSLNTTSSMAYFSNGNAAGGAGGFQVIAPSSTKSFYILVYNGTTTSVFNGVGGTNATLDIRDGLWHHLAVTIYGSSVKIYKDGGDAAINATNTSNNQGTPFATWTSGVSYTGNTGNAYYLGRNGNYPGYYYNGSQDEIAFFEYELTSQNVIDIYNGGSPVMVDSNGLNLMPTGYWRGGDDDNGAGTTITDQGSGGNNASLLNGASITSIGSGESIYV